MNRKHKTTMSYLGASMPIEALKLVEKTSDEETYHFLHSKKFSSGIKKISVRKKITSSPVIGSTLDKTSITGTVGLDLTVTDLGSIIQIPQ